MAKRTLRVDLPHLAALLKRVAEVDSGSPRITVGVHASEGVSATGVPIAMIASVHEFGSPARNVPARPYLRPTFEAHRGRYAMMIRGALIKSIIKGADLRPLLALVGEKSQSDVLRKLRSNIAPKLSPRTIQRRRAKLKGNKGRARNNRFSGAKQKAAGGIDNQGFTALIDTGQNLKNRIRYVVEMGAWRSVGEASKGNR
jgi:hypothetical protein